MSELITIREAATLLSVEEQTVRTAVSRGVLRDHAPGHRGRAWPRLELRQVLERAAAQRAPKSVQQLRFENCERVRRWRERKLAREAATGAIAGGNDGE